MASRNMLLGVFVGGIVGALGGLGGGFAVGIFAFPYLFPPPELNEPLVDKSQGEALARARFVHADPSDPIHYGQGAATIYADLVRLEADFKVGPGPKYHVYLVPRAGITPDTAVATTMYVDLGRLKAFGGSQNYPVPTGVDPLAYASLVIWCEQFNVLISPADITPVAPARLSKT